MYHALCCLHLESTAPQTRYNKFKHRFPTLKVSPGILAASDDKSRILKFQQELEDLESRLSQCMTLGIAQKTAKMEIEHQAMSQYSIISGFLPADISQCPTIIS